MRLDRISTVDRDALVYTGPIMRGDFDDFVRDVARRAEERMKERCVQAAKDSEPCEPYGHAQMDDIIDAIEDLPSEYGEKGANN